MVASDYGLSPEVIFKNDEAGGASAAIGGLIGGRYGGSASKTDFGGFGALGGSSAAGRLGGYTNTPEGKVITAAFGDFRARRQAPSQVAPRRFKAGAKSPAPQPARPAACCPA